MRFVLLLLVLAFAAAISAHAQAVQMRTFRR